MVRHPPRPGRDVGAKRAKAGGRPLRRSRIALFYRPHDCLVGGGGGLKHALGIGFFLIFAATVWSASPLIAMGFNVLVRSDYHLREFGNEYRARLMPNRVRWYDYRTYHMD